MITLRGLVRQRTCLASRQRLAHIATRRGYATQTTQTAITPEVPPATPPAQNSPVPRARARSGPDGTLYWVTLLSFLATPAIVYFYYEHRKEHMRVKKERLLAELQERYKGRQVT